MITHFELDAYGYYDADVATDKSEASMLVYRAEVQRSDLLGRRLIKREYILPPQEVIDTCGIHGLPKLWGWADLCWFLEVCFVQPLLAAREGEDDAA